MGKENTVLQKIRSSYRIAKIYWRPILSQAWRDAWTLWLWIFVIPLSANLVGVVFFIINNGWQEFILQLDSFFWYYCLGFALTLGVIFGYFAITSPAMLYKAKKELAWRRTWHDVEIKAVHYPYHNGFGVGLSFVSDKPDEFEITNFYPKVTKVANRHNTLYQSNIPSVGIELKALQQESKAGAFYPRTDALHIPRRKTIGEGAVAVQVAHWYTYSFSPGHIENNTVIEGKIEEEGKEPKHHNVSGDPPFKVEITLSGLLNTHDKMDLCYIVCEIRKDGDKGIALSMTRSQEYEYEGERFGT